jgi:hypothetical protein
MKKSFWDQTSNPVPTEAQPDSQEEFEQLVQENTEAELSQVFEDQEDNDEEEDDSLVLSNANLRLEQGRLYQMIMNHNIFADTDADPQAIKNVQRQIKRFAREQMELMLGMRQESPKNETIVSSPFNELEVIALKTIAAQMSKGATRMADIPKTIPATPKKDGISPISVNKPKPSPPTVSKPLPKNAPAKAAAKPASGPQVGKVPADETLLTKPISEMTPQELLEYDSKAVERHKNLKAAIPTNMVPMPSPQEMEMLYQSRANTIMINAAKKMLTNNQ